MPALGQTCGGHTHIQYILAPDKFYTNHGPGSWTLQEKGKSQKPAHGLPLQARVVAANRTVLTTSCDDPGAHGNEQGGGQSKMNGGKNVEGSGHGIAKVAGKQSRQNKAAAGEHSRRTIRPAQASKKQQPAVGQPRSKTTAADDVGRPLAVQCRLVEGVRWCWHSRGGLRPTYLSPSHLSPLPVSVHTHSLNLEKPNLAPT